MKQRAAVCWLAALGMVCLLASGCATALAPSNLPALVSVTSTPIAVGPDQDAGPLARGEASAANILGLVSFGNASIRAAAGDGGITKIKTVDAHTTNVLGIWAIYTTVVTGH